MLRSIYGGRLVPDSRITLSFRDGRATGNAGCNRYGSPYVATGELILRLSAVEQTEVSCGGAVGVQEREYLYLLGRTARYYLSDRKLELVTMGNEVALAFDRKPRTPMDPDTLAHTAWELTSMDGKPLLRGSKLAIAFERGELTGSTQCGWFEGPYRANPDFLVAGSLGRGYNACGKPYAFKEQEDRYVSHLEQSSEYHVLGDELRLLTHDGHELRFRRLREPVSADPRSGSA